MSELKKLKEDPELLGRLEEEIREISGAVRRLLAGPLKKRAVILLIKDSIRTTTGVGLSDVEVVIDAIEGLDNQYLKKKIKN